MADLRLSDLSSLDGDEPRERPFDWNDTAEPLPAVDGVHDLVAAHVRRDPDATAVVFEDQSLTYGELDARSNQLANYLRAQGVGPEMVLGLCLARGLDMVVAPLAVMKAGAAYLPLDPDYPVERLTFMLSDSRTSVLVGHSEILDDLPLQRARLVALDDPAVAAAIAAAPTDDPAVPTHPDQLAYLIYTSGSTGRPKGAMLTHHGAVNLVEVQRRFFQVHVGSVSLQFAPFSFDAAAAEIFVALGAGATLVVATSEARTDPSVLGRLVRDAGVTAATFPPSLMRALDPADVASLQSLVSAGEPLTRELAEQWGEGRHLVNGYGLTETTVCASLGLWDPANAGAPSIGRPQANMRVYVLDEQLRPLSTDLPGEIYVAGLNVARGYLGRPALTAERFVADPWDPTGGRLYRTGDRGRRRFDDQLEYMGRVDQQVKVSGYRIEPGEVEAALVHHDAIDAAVVVARTLGEDRHLVAYVVPTDVIAGIPTTSDLRAFLARDLPEHMLPALFVELDMLPLNPNGKVDRGALPEPDGLRPVLASRYVEPATATEEVLAGLWAEVLGLEQVGAEDNFFELGGRSLVATQLVSRFPASFGVELPLVELFTHPTVRELAAVIDAAPQVGPTAPIVPVDRDQPLPLSFAQQRLWFLHQLDPDSTEYNVPGPLRLEGPLDVAALSSALDALVERHEILRTRLVAVDGVGQQVVDPPRGFGLEVVDLSDDPDPEALAAQLAADDVARPFDMAAGSLFRGRLLRLGPDDHLLSLVVHHVVCDAWSARILQQELEQLYEAFHDGMPSPLAPLSLHYADFAVWQREWLQGDVLDGQLAYWRERLAGAPILELPTDKARPAVRSSAGAVVGFDVPPETAAALQELSRTANATIFMTLLAAFDVLLGRSSGQDDVVVGTPIANRNRPEVDNLVGFFVNTLVLRADLSGDPTFTELLARVRDGALGAYAHQDLPFERLVDELQPERDRSRTPLFQVLFTYEQEDRAGHVDRDAGGVANAVDTEPGLGVARFAASEGSARFDLTLSLVDDPQEGLGGTVEYSTDLFDAASIQRLVAQWLDLLATVGREPDRRLSELASVDDAERHRLLVEWNDTRTDPAFCLSSVHELVAARRPDAVAVRCAGESVSYGELDRRANQLAHHLRARGVGGESVVGVCLDRSVDLVVALLAISKAGGAYLPLDPEYPASRLAVMLADSAAALVVAKGRPDVPTAVVDLDEVDTTGYPGDAPPVDVDPQQAAYVLFTSGSTGRPKGVVVPHQGLVNRLRWMQDQYRLVDTDRVLHKTPTTFDVSLWELLWPLTVGAQLVVLEPGRHRDVDHLVSEMAEERVSVAHFVPALFRDFVTHPEVGALRDLRLVVCSGEVLSGETVARAHAAHETLVVENLYGPTEASIDVTSWTCRRDADLGRRVPIGAPIANTQVYVLDRHLSPVPVGVPGELYLGGRSLARGYAGRAALTAERFVADPFGAPGGRLYRTGDRVRWRPEGVPEGVIEFLGRLDEQVKVRGFRVEPGEVEAALVAHPEVRAAAVTAGEDLLVAYLVAEDPAVGVPNVTDLRTFAAQQLPGFMVPSVFVELAELPVTGSGKVDRAALPTPGDGRPDLAAAFVAPRTPTEELLCGVWAEVLGVAAVGVEDGFFELGGHSLLATQVMSRVRNVFGVDVPLAALFDHPTVAGLAAVVETGTTSDVGPITPADRREPLPLSSAQRRLWFLDQLEPESLDYVVPVRLGLSGEVDEAALAAALTALVERHEVLRTRLVAVDGVPVQVIDPPSPVDLQVMDTEAALIAAEHTPFDLAAGPLLRAGLLRRDDDGDAGDEHVVSVVVHHVVADDWSLGILRRELGALYEAFRHGEPSPLPPLAVQYGDFAVWQNDWLSGAVLDDQLSYWRDRLAGAAVLDLPTDRPRLPVRSSAGASQTFVIPAEVATGLRTVARGANATMSMTLLAVFDVLLGRYADQDDVVVGTPIANRNRAEIEDLIGFFVNTLVLRTDLSGDPTFSGLLARVRADALGAYAHQDLPFEALVDDLQPERDRSRTPLFQVLFDYVTTTDDPAQAPHDGAVQDTVALFDLTLVVSDTTDGRAIGEIQYSTELFDDATIERFAGHLLALLHQVAEDPERPLSALVMVDEPEVQELLAVASGPPLDLDPHDGIDDLVADHARRDPDAIAVKFGDDTLTYGQLDDRADQLAARLRAAGVTPEAIVGLCVERGLDMVVGLLAVMKTGAAYLPLEPELPTARLAYMLEDSAAAAVVGPRALVDSLRDHVDRLVVLDEDSNVDSNVDEVLGSVPTTETTVPTCRADQAACVIYTSGSTGLPKGVVLTHGGLSAVLAAWVDAHLRGERPLRWLSLSSFAFDVFTGDVLRSLCLGGSLVIAPARAAATAEDLARLVADEHIEAFECAPRSVDALIDTVATSGDGLESLRLLVVTTDVWRTAGLARARAVLSPELRLLTAFGLTETTIDSTYCDLHGLDAGTTIDQALPIGGPLPNTRAYVLDRHMIPVPGGVPGDLFVGGPGVARGYRHRPALTAARFVADPFVAGARLYRTGDRARRRAHGQLEFLGRSDQQLNIRGHRVEPGEVEAALVAHAGIAAAVVNVIQAVDSLAAYVVAADRTVGMPPVDELRSHLGTKLPEYMVPSAFVELGSIPSTPNGKVDYAALPLPGGDRPELAGEVLAPRNATEEIVAGLWAEVLGLDVVGVADNFFDLGGHSLLATQVIARLRRSFEVEVTLAELFDHPTVARLAAAVDAGTRGPSAPPIVPVPRDSRLPLSFAQQRLWFLDQLGPGSTEYVISFAFRVDDEVHADVLEAALRALVDRHEVLRSRFLAVEGVPWQEVDPPGGFVLDVTDVSAEPDPDAAAESVVAQDAGWIFDLAAGPLFRARLVRVGTGHDLVSVVMHHAVCDEWSVRVLRRELEQLYEAFRRGEPSPLVPLPVQYGDFAVWQRGWLTGAVLDDQLAYWRERLVDVPVLELPTDRPRPPVRSSAGARQEFAVPPAVVEGMRDLSRSAGATMFMSALAAFKVLLGRWAATDDVVVGTPVAGRTRAEIEELIGLFVNTLVVRTDLSGDPSFREVVTRVRHEALGAFAHQDVPFEQLVDAFAPDRDRSRTPLFQVLFNYEQPGTDQDEPDDGSRSTDEGAGEASPELAELPGGTVAKFDLRLIFVEEDDRISGAFEYSTALFDETTIQRMIGSLVALLDIVAADPDRHLSTLPLVDPTELDQTLVAWNDTAAPLPHVAGVHELIADQATRRPDVPAVVFGDSTVTYAELLDQVNRLANYLQTQGVGPEIVVGLCLDRGIELVVAMLAVLRAGGAYVALEPADPVDRTAFLLSDSRVSLVAGATDLLDALPATRARLVFLDDPPTSAAIAAASRQALATDQSPSQIAYVTYTSGSTGRPKGVLVTHEALTAYVSGVVERLGFAPECRYLLLQSPAVDLGYTTLFGCLAVGGTLHVAAREVGADPAAFRALVAEHEIDYLKIVPSQLAALTADTAAEDLLPRRALVLGGEASPAGWAQGLVEQMGDRPVFNHYGPTETTVGVTTCRLSTAMSTAMSTATTTMPPGAANAPIGSPLPNDRIYVLDRDLSPVPVGVPGELYVGGRGLARGYAGRAALTAERFVADPFGAPGGRLYRTGDRVRWRSGGVPEGVIEFLGRLDEQVKVRGFRVEPGEVEAALMAHPAIAAAAVVGWGDTGDVRLAAHVVAADPAVGVPPTDELRAFLSTSLLDAMLPSTVSELPELPLLPSGKLDRKALPAPGSGRPDLRRSVVLPRTPTEELLSGVWAEVLGVDVVGVEDSFFDLGGHSLLATRVVSRVRAVLGVEVSLGALFDAPTVRGVAAVVDGATAAVTAPPITPAERDGPLPLSFAQQRLWFLDQLEPGSLDYVVPVRLGLRGEVDEAALAAALGALVDRHEVLRSRLVAVDGVPVQVVDPPGPVDLRVVDDEAVLAEWEQAPFDLAAGPLLRAGLVRPGDDGDDEHVVNIVVHHVVADDWSLGILRRELGVLYEAFHNGEGSPLAPLAVQYGDFAVWQRDWLSGEVLDNQLTYWRERLTGAMALDLPTDRPRPAQRSSAGASRTFAIPGEIAEALRAATRDANATMFMTLLAAFDVVLGRYAGHDDVVVGTPIANRNRTEVEDLIGFFVNTLVLRTDLSGDPTFTELLDRVRSDALGAYAHQDLPFEALVDDLQPERDRSRTPLFQVMFNYLATDDAQPATPDDDNGVDNDDDERGAQHTATVSLFDLTLVVYEPGSGGLGGQVHYSTELFDAATIDRLVKRFVAVVEAVAHNPNQRLSELALADDTERHRVLQMWNDTAAPRPTVPGGVPELIAARAAAAAPDALAVVFGDQAITYAELDERVGRLAGYLLSRGVVSEAVVGVALDRSIELVVAALAVLRAGGVYLPLDPGLPAERLRFMVSDSAAALVLTAQSHTATAGALGSPVVVLDDHATAAEIAAAPPAPLAPIASEHAAYVMFTSGSTGQPKGVVVPHGGLVNRLLWMQDVYELTPADRVLHKTPVGFDVSMWELLWPLVAGATLVVLEPEHHRDVDRIVRCMARDHVTVTHFVPSLFHGFSRHPDVGALDDLRLVVCSGEVLAPADVAWLHEAHPHVVVENLYGPTEASIDVTAHTCRRDHPPTAPLPIGAPIANTQVFVLDRQLSPLPPGVPGELYLGGQGLARGYGSRPALTAASFVAHPFQDDGGRLYRTGDRVSWRADGTLDYLGRLDHQVKLRGQRIEPAEIETALATHSSVAAALVLLRTDDGRPPRLVAYVVPADTTAGVPPVGELRAHLAQILPTSMLPEAFVELATFPLTPNGKVDRKALPRPDAHRPDLDDEAVRPRTLTEELLAGLWAEALDVDLVGVTDNFFDLGGHSLLATQVVARLRGLFEVEVSLAELFDHPTVAGLAAVVDRGRAAPGLLAPPIEPVEHTGRRPLSFAQQRLWFLDQLDPGSTAYSVPLRLDLAGAVDVAALQGALGALVTRHEVLRTRFVAAEGVPWQVVDPPGELALDVVDAVDEADVSRLLDEDVATPFDLAMAPLFRARLIRLGDEDHVLSLVMHHAVCDEWSIRVLRQELEQLYEASRTGEPSPLAPLPVQYGDFAVWQRGWLTGDVLDDQLAYWRQRLEDVPVLELPTDRPRPPVRSSVGARVEFSVPPAVVDALRGVSRGAGATMFMTALAAFEVLLGRWAATDDVVVGTPVAGRTRAEVEELIGLFVNTLVLRSDLSGDPSFREMVGRVRSDALGAFAHQDIPFEQLVDAFAADRDRSRTPLFQVLFNYDRADPDADADADADAGAEVGPGDRAGDEPEQPGSAVAKFDLRLVLVEQPHGMGGAVEYSTALFDHTTVERMVGHLLTLLQQVAAEPDRRLSELSVLTPAEVQQLLQSGNVPTETTTPPRPVAVHELMTTQAMRTPDAPAVVASGRTLRYGDLHDQVRRLANYLQAQGVGPDVVVGVCADRSVEWVVTVLAVLDAGGVYLPVDPAQPTERVAFMLGDSRVSLLLGRRELLDDLPVAAGRVVALDDPATVSELADQQPVARPTAGTHPGQLAYVIYTSGSTGRPKGVMVSHDALADYVPGVVDRLGFEPGRRFGLLQSPAVDFGHTMLFAALSTGGVLHVADERTSTDPRLVEEFLAAGIDYLKIGPSHLAALAGDTGLASLLPERTLVLGGEATPVSWARDLLAAADDRQVHNHYGPTETTVGVAAGPITTEALAAERGANVPIGRPLGRDRLFVLDAALGLAPTGVAGELYVGGPGLARGYLGRAGLTAEKFVANPHAADGSRIYRTGDRARWRPDGQLEFLGRVDDQLKVRGVRVEPGEVAAVLGAHPRLAAAVVTAHPAGDRLVGYVVPADPAVGAPTAGELRTFAARTLPEQMVPVSFVELTEIPRTAAGKVDRAALPAASVARPTHSGGFMAPLSPAEEALASVWAEVLGIDQIGTGENFFDLGGHSLLATQAVARGRDRGYDLAVTDYYDTPTLAVLARLARPTEESGAGSVRATIAIRRGHVVPMVFVVHEIGGGASDFQELASWLEPGQQLYGLQSRGLFDDTPPLETVEDMAATYLQEVRELQPDGPYVFAGLSMGGYVAVEMGRQATAEGSDVAAIVMLGAPEIEVRVGGESVHKALRDQLLGEIDEALQGPPGTRVSRACEEWFVSEWTMTDEERSRFLSGDKQMLRMARIVETNRQASARYQSTIVSGSRRRLLRRRDWSYRGRVVLFVPEAATAEETRLTLDPWRMVLPSPEILTAPGTHNSMIKGRGAEVMGRFLADEVDRLGE